MRCGVDDRIDAIDRPLAATLGYRPDQLIGRRAIDLVMPAARPRILSAAAMVRRDGAVVQSLPCDFRTAAGRPVTLRLTLTNGDQPGTLDASAQPATPVAPPRAARASTEQAAELLRTASAAAATAASAVQGLMEATTAAIEAALTQVTVAAAEPSVSDVDPLTGLATRSMLLEALDDGVEQGADFAVLLVDLDEFKCVNDTHGHEIGDDVLVHVADRLRACVRPDDLVVRFGGDEFVILCRAASAARQVASRVVTLLAPPMETSAGPIPITASVGISDGRIAVDSAGDLLSRADAAMYWAKRLGKNQFFAYDADLHERTQRDRRIRQLLVDAVHGDRMRVHYQPIMSTGDESVMGVEAVARLLDDDGTMLLPAQFLPVARRAGLLAAIDAVVLAESCRCMGDIARRTGRTLSVSVNVSAQFVARPDLVDTVKAAVVGAGLPPSTLMLELTEETLIDASDAVIGRLSELRALGVRLALDNFGAGFAPLNLLRRLPLSHIKVDRPCIIAMLTDDRDAAMIEAVTWLVDQLGLAWIAEGVETEEQWEAVQRFGPGYAQGYLFARPLGEEALLDHLRTGFGGTPHRGRVSA